MKKKVKYSVEHKYLGNLREMELPLQEVAKDFLTTQPPLRHLIADTFVRIWRARSTKVAELGWVAQHLQVPEDVVLAAFGYLQDRHGCTLEEGLKLWAAGSLIWQGGRLWLLPEGDEFACYPWTLDDGAQGVAIVSREYGVQQVSIKSRDQGRD